MNNLPNTKRKSENVHSFLAFLLFICFSFTSYYIQAQEVKGITLNVQNETAENVFNQLSIQTGLKFFYDQEIVNYSSPHYPQSIKCLSTGCFRSVLLYRQNCISIGIIIQYLLVNRNRTRHFERYKLRISREELSIKMVNLSLVPVYW